MLRVALATRSGRMPGAARKRAGSPFRWHGAEVSTPRSERDALRVIRGGATKRRDFTREV